MADNNIIKKPHQKDLVTPEQEEEISKCMDDVVYFSENYVRIIHATRGRVPFEPWPYQIEMLREFQKNRFNICLTARQMGKCVSGDTLIKLKSPSGEIIKITIQEFYNLLTKETNE